jgi:hypothetical protein
MVAISIWCRFLNGKSDHHLHDFGFLICFYSGMTPDDGPEMRMRSFEPSADSAETALRKNDLLVQDFDHKHLHVRLTI